MALQPGTQIGTYEIISLIGAGGMGEVYKARDPRLNRLVALKILPAALAGNRDFLARFAREAKAVAALSHPNVLGIFDLASQDGLTYAVMELLEGDSLRERLKGGALPPKRAVEIAVELAQGLGAAHEKGIIHRDVKPENIFLTREGRVKVLDFGLAKQVAPRGGTGAQETEAILATEAGMVLGTAGYMSPEQVRGETADHRADIFAFGVVLYEMLSGLRPFKGATAAQTMAAILEQEPPALAATRGPLPPALERLVAHCLEKHPEGRFQSMKDLAYDLQNLGTTASDPAGKAVAPRRRAFAPGQLALGAGAALILVALLGLLRLPPFHRPGQPAFTRLTFAPGTVDAARFGADGRTVYFSQRLQGGRPDLYVLRPDEPEPRPLGVPDALLLGVSAANELAILHEPRGWFSGQWDGTLAQVSGSGGALKEIQDHAVEAAWDGQSMALIATDESGKPIRLEFPAGRTILQGLGSNLTIKTPRLSPDGAQLAVVTADSETKADLLLWDRQGHSRTLFTKVGDLNGDTLTGLAWGPGGAVWCSEQQGDQTTVWSITPRGRPQTHWRGPGLYQLMDVSTAGRMLLVQQQIRRSVVLQRAGEAQPKDLSVLGGTQGAGLSDDGQILLLLESGVQDGGTAQDLAYVRRLDGSPALRLAKGLPRTLSLDGKWLHLITDSLTPQDLDPAILAAYRMAGLDPRTALDPATHQAHMVMVPTGAGHPFVVALPGRFESGDACRMMPDGRTLVFLGTEKGRPPRYYRMDRSGGEPVGVTPEGFGGLTIGLNPISPDGKRFLVFEKHKFYLQALEGGEPQLVKGLAEHGEGLIRWAADGRAVFLRDNTNPLAYKIFRLDLGTGARTPVLTFTVPDPAGFDSFRSAFMTPDARTFVFTYTRNLSELYLVEGVQ